MKIKRREFIHFASAGIAAAGFPVSQLSARPSAEVDRVMLQGILDDAAGALGVVGGQMAIFDGENLHEFTTGHSNLERNLTVTVDTLFQIGSTTKVFNAAVIMALVDEGALDLDAPVKTWIKDFQLPDDKAAEVVNLRQLTSMSAGIDNGPYEDHGRGDDALERYVASLAEIPLIFEPGTAFGYSNACTNISGLAAVRASGKNWETLLAEKILKPLSLSQTASFAEDLLYHPVALGYFQDPDSKKPQRVPFWGLPRSMAPAGATLCCSAGDLVRFARMFLVKGNSESGDQVISADAVKTMHTPQVTLPNRVMAHKWCTGPYWKVWDDEVIYGHSGTNTGGSSMLLWCPARNFAIATIANVPSQGYPFADRIFSTVFPSLFGINKPKAPSPDEVERVVVDLDRYTGVYVALNKRVVFSIEDDRLVARAYLGSQKESTDPSITSEMIPLGSDRFLPAELAMSGNRNWDVAFWGRDESGRATHYLDGVFAARRAG